MRQDSLGDGLSGEKLRLWNTLQTCKHAADVQGEKAATINHPVCENTLKLQHQPLYLGDKLSSFFSLPQTSSQHKEKGKITKRNLSEKPFIFTSLDLWGTVHAISPLHHSPSWRHHT